MTSADTDFAPEGLDAVTGAYLHPAAAVADVARLALGQPPDPRHVAEVSAWHQERTAVLLGPREGIDARDLAAAGWGVIFAHGADPAVRDALSPLLDLRRRQASAIDERLYREIGGEAGYRPGETKSDFLARHGAGPGPVDPRRVPYYLLLVGGPEEIPFAFQHQLDVPYAVGRLAFDTAEEYAAYARSVVEAEARPATSRRAVLFGATHPGDRATTLMSELLVKRLAAFLETETPDWSIETHLGDGATKDRLGTLLGGDATPSFLFTASHGMGFPAGDPRQHDGQGALLCQDWPGPTAWQGPIPRDHYFAAEDLTAAARPAGLVSFHYACHGAGTPDSALAPRPFVARLPQRLLAGGALAVIGHVERSWGYSFVWKGAGGQSQVFEDAAKRLLTGYPVGAALEPFHLRYAELAADLADEIERVDYGKTPDPEKLARLWTATRDARNYVILGDPAVRALTP